MSLVFSEHKVRVPHKRWTVFGEPDATTSSALSEGDRMSLGEIRWLNGGYVWEQRDDVGMRADGLREVADFIEAQR